MTLIRAAEPSRQVSGDAEVSVAERFESQAETYAARVAVKHECVELTYDGLNRLSNGIAVSILSALGLGSEPVVLLFDHGAALISAIIGTLKAGKIYVPLDPTFPEAHSRAIVTDCKPRLILTDANHRQLAESLGETHATLCVDNLQALDENLSIRITPDDAACILYTSGSTGEPKGVVHNQRNLVHSALAYVRAARISPEDRLTLLSRCIFAASISHLFGALLTGASLYPLDVRSTGIARLHALLAEECVTIYHSVPTLFRHFATDLAATLALPHLRLIKLGGETVLKTDVELYQRCFCDNCRLVVTYGMTEINVVRQFPVDKQTVISGPVAPVGYAIDDTEIVLVDESGNIVSDDVGEIEIRSRYLASGYWAKPELSNACFRTLEDDPRVRSFRTGDVGEWGKDGCLIHLGRKDHQVKIRGHRVDASFVESALLEMRGVREAAVVATRTPSGDPSLTAHVCLQPWSEQNVRELRASMEERVPAYMVPQAFVIADVLPLTENGKIDRLALARSTHNVEPQTAYANPRNHLEYQLVRIWEELLGISPIGVHDNFVDLGGDSLAAARMVGTIEREFGSHLPPSVLSSVSTIAGLAKAIVDGCPPSMGPQLTLVSDERRGKEFFFLHGDWDSGGLYCRNLASQLGSYCTFYSLAPHPADSTSTLPTIEEMASDNLRLIREIQPRGPYRLGGFCNGGLVSLEMACQLESAGESVERLAAIGTCIPNPALLPVSDLVRSMLGQASVRRMKWLHDVWALPANEKLSRLRHKLGKVLGRRTPPARENGLEAPTSIGLLYRERMREYIPRRCRTSVLVLWGREDPTAASSDVRAGWQRVSPEVRFYVIGGDHQACVTDYGSEVVDLIARYFSD